MQVKLPPEPKPEGNNSIVNLRANRTTFSIQFPIFQNQFLFQGRLGRELTTQEGYLAMQLCSLNVLAQLQSKVGFRDFQMYYQSIEGWDDAPKVADGAPDLFTNVLGKAGKHTRSLSGAASLPRNFSMGLVANFTYNSNC